MSVLQLIFDPLNNALHEQVFLHTKNPKNEGKSHEYIREKTLYQSISAEDDKPNSTHQ